MKQAASLKDFRTTNLLPGIRINTSPIDFAPLKQVQLTAGYALLRGRLLELC